MRYSRSLMLPFSILMLLLTATPSISQQRPTISSYGTMRVMFEIELQGTDDTHYLYDEAAIGVLGTVQQTPRYGVNGEAWVHGMWMQSHFFDTTLSDRFVVECTEEEAISMSIYAWVEWTAPILEGTTYDGESSIFFEYGAESEVLQPPWDIAGPHGEPSDGSGYAVISSSHVRTGEKSVKLYQPPPSKLGGDRRIVLREYIGTTENDIYWSFWVYFPSDDAWTTNGSNGWGHTLGGIRWAIIDNGVWDFSGIMFYIHQDRYLQIVYSHFFSPSDDVTVTPSPTWYTYDHLDEWVHFQAHLKFTMYNTGVAQAWVNDNLELDLSGLKTDPKAYPAWEQGGYYYAGGSPLVVASLYGSADDVEVWYWVDDLVASTEKVPENYGVLD